jgi:hypothetical protein
MEEEAEVDGDYGADKLELGFKAANEDSAARSVDSKNPDGNGGEADHLDYLYGREWNGKGRGTWH